MKIITKTKDVILEALFPSSIKCILCGRDVPDFENSPFCSNCLSEGIFNDANRCVYCDNPILDGNKVCDFCKEKHKSFDKAFCPFIYTGKVRSAILKLKDDNGRYLAPTFAKYMAKRIQDEKVDFDIIIPVPLYKKKLAKRGYNQSELLSNELGKLLGKPVCTDLLLKIKESSAQKNLNFAQRQQNLAGTLSLTDKNFVKDKKILVVDDVMTTGATLNACASLLKHYHCSAVYVSAIARNPLEKVDKK